MYKGGFILLNYISLYPNEHESEFNDEFIFNTQDKSVSDFIIMAMREFEAVENIKIENIEVIENQDEVNLNHHMININYKKKNLEELEYPKNKFIVDHKYGEIIFTIRISTNLNEKVITKRILLPLQDQDGYFHNNNKKMRPIWQMVDASTYSQRSRITLKSRMPITVYCNKYKKMMDVDEIEHSAPLYRYVLNSKSRKPSSKTISRYINPLMIYMAKIGFDKAREFFGMKDIVFVSSSYEEKDKEIYYIFEVDNMYLKVDKYLFDKYELVRNFSAMVYNLTHKRFPVSKAVLEDREFWVCRIGLIGPNQIDKHKSITTFREKGITTIYMIERLLDDTTIHNLRLPDIYKHNIYFLLYWIITNFEYLKKRSNIDMYNKRVRKNEYIVNSSLGKKINENLNKLIEKKSKSKMNTMDTLLELFNFNSDIVFAGMRNLNDLVKADDLVNDMTFLMDLAYSAKGPNSLGEGSSRSISTKYRYLHPSMIGVLDLTTSSNSDVGMSGSFVPFVETYNGFYFTPDKEPCMTRYKFDKQYKEEDNGDVGINVSDFDSYISDMEEKSEFIKLLSYEKIEIIEREI